MSSEDGVPVEYVGSVVVASRSDDVWSVVNAARNIYD